MTQSGMVGFVSANKYHIDSLFHTFLIDSQNHFPFRIQYNNASKQAVNMYFV